MTKLTAPQQKIVNWMNSHERVKIQSGFNGFSMTGYDPGQNVQRTFQGSIQRRTLVVLESKGLIVFVDGTATDGCHYAPKPMTWTERRPIVGKYLNDQWQLNYGDRAEVEVTEYLDTWEAQEGEDDINRHSDEYIWEDFVMYMAETK